MKYAFVLPAVLVLVSAGSAVAVSPAPDFSAVVDSSGALQRGFRATGASHLATGQYEVDFSQDVTQCGFTGSIGAPGTASSNATMPPAGSITITGRQGNANAVLVLTFDAHAVAADNGFHVVAAC